MIIKTIRHKGNSIKKLLLYMIEGMEDQQDLMIAHNLPSFDMDQMIHSYLTNDTYRQAPAQVRHYHEVLSFSPRDSELLTSNKLEKIAREYIQKRNPKALCFAVAHLSSDHFHLHFMFSGTEWRSKNTLRMDDTTFQELRVGMEQYQQKHFPELKHSIVYLNKERKKERAISRDRNSRAAKAYQLELRGGVQTEKEELTQIISDAYDRSESLSEFYENIEEEGIILSYRKGKINGVKRKRKYRFTRLGISEDMLHTLERFESRMERMKAITTPDRDLELEL
ncbi:MAG: relaxase/mobilization nuclease domain-containing protein [Bacteroidota bacterium]